ncbi:MAG: uracil-DNA glycosylase [Solirubrobacterales bacterium]|nr:uracil-DNA glycosylase [Solirubrobacterales bacterium]
MPASSQTRASALRELRDRASVCTRCPKLAATRTQVVFGSGPPDADLMFVGEAPGATEDRDGIPFVGAAGRLLDKLLAEIGLTRDDVAVVNILKCRPPDNRNPLAGEIENCQEYLFGQLELMQPTVVCTLGNFATRLLRGSTEGITKVHGHPEVRVIGPRAVRLYPLFHPAAALYTPSNVELLRADMARIPELLALGAPEQPVPATEPEPSVAAELPVPAGGAVPASVDDRQLGLF